MRPGQTRRPHGRNNGNKSAVRVRIRSRSTLARPPSTAIIKRPVLVPVSAHGSANDRNCALASTICFTMKAALHHVRRSCDLSSLTSSAAHSRASGIFPASLKARAFARAWLSADRSAADSFPARAPRVVRVAADMVRIAIGPTRVRQATNLDRRRFDRNFYSLPPARGVAGADRGPPRQRGTLRNSAPPPTRRIDPRVAHAAPIINPRHDLKRGRWLGWRSFGGRRPGPLWRG
jgi:hypothetical protein